MRSWRWQIGLGLVAVLVGGVAVTVAWQAASAREAVRVEIAALRAQRQQMLPEAAALVGEQALVKAEVVLPPPVGAPAAAAKEESATTSHSRAGEFSARLMTEADDPAHQNREVVMQRENMRLENDGFFSALKFSPEQVERFLDIEAVSFGRRVDVGTVMKARGLARDDEALMTLHGQIEDDFERDIRSEFSDEVWSKFDKYRETAWARNVAAGFAGIALLADMPIDAEQGAQLLAVIVDATARGSDASIRYPCRIDWDAVDAHAKRFLTPSQWELFRSVESPGVAGGGARFVTRLNDAFLTAIKEEEAKPAPSR